MPGQASLICVINGATRKKPEDAFLNQSQAVRSNSPASGWHGGGLLLPEVVVDAARFLEQLALRAQGMEAAPGEEAVSGLHEQRAHESRHSLGSPGDSKLSNTQGNAA